MAFERGHYSSSSGSILFHDYEEIARRERRLEAFALDLHRREIAAMRVRVAPLVRPIGAPPNAAHVKKQSKKVEARKVTRRQMPSSASSPTRRPRSASSPTRAKKHSLAARRIYSARAAADQLRSDAQLRSDVLFPFEEAARRGSTRAQAWAERPPVAYDDGHHPPLPKPPRAARMAASEAALTTALTTEKKRRRKKKMVSSREPRRRWFQSAPKPTQWFKEAETPWSVETEEESLGFQLDAERAVPAEPKRGLSREEAAQPTPWFVAEEEESLGFRLVVERAVSSGELPGLFDDDDEGDDETTNPAALTVQRHIRGVLVRCRQRRELRRLGAPGFKPQLTSQPSRVAAQSIYEQQPQPTRVTGSQPSHVAAPLMLPPSHEPRRRRPAAIQAAVRGFLARRRPDHRGAAQIQAVVRGVLARKRPAHVARIQAHCSRGPAARRRQRARRRAAFLLQNWAMGLLLLRKQKPITLLLEDTPHDWEAPMVHEDCSLLVRRHEEVSRLQLSLAEMDELADPDLLEQLDLEVELLSQIIRQSERKQHPPAPLLLLADDRQQ